MVSIHVIEEFMLDLESWRLPVVIEVGLMSRTRPKRIRINKKLFSIISWTSVKETPCEANNECGTETGV